MTIDPPERNSESHDGNSRSAVDRFLQKAVDRIYVLTKRRFSRPGRKCEIVKMLESLGPRARPLIPGLIELLGSRDDPDDKVKQIRTAREQELADSVEPEVVPLLDDPDQDVRIQAARVLVQIGRGSLKSYRVLLEAFQAWDEEEIRGAHQYYYGAPPEIAADLAEIVSDRSLGISHRSQAYLALGHIENRDLRVMTPYIIRWLESDDEFKCGVGLAPTLKRMKESNPERIPAPEDLRRIVSLLCRRVREDIREEEALRFLDPADMPMRMYSLSSLLSACDDPEIIFPILTELATHHDGRFRQLGIWELIEFAGPRKELHSRVEPLIQRALKDADPFVRIRLLRVSYYAFTEDLKRESFAAGMEALRMPDPDVRDEAADMIGRLFDRGDEVSRELMRRELTDYPEVIAQLDGNSWVVKYALLEHVPPVIDSGEK